MRIALLNAPGRFPTVNHDVGTWWAAISAAHELSNVSANFMWWEHVCASAAEALDAFRSGAAFESADAYCRSVGDLDDSIAALNEAQDELVVTLGQGPEVRGVDYSDSRSVIDFSKRDSLLARDIEASLAEVGPIDLALLRVTSPIDLLSGAIVARVLRARKPGLHVCLIDHGYENFSLKAHLPGLEKSGALTEAFDSLIAEKDDIDALVPELVARLDAGEPVRGFLRREWMRAGASATVPSHAPPPLTPIFSPVPVLQTRLSPAGCYWGRCTYCTQNAKYAGSGGPSKSAIGGVLDRLEAYVGVGCRTFIFADEALSPAMLRSLSEEILSRGLDIDWTCRSKLERNYDEALVRLCAKAGCREILFGLETISPDLLRRMDKYVAGQTPEDVAAIFQSIGHAGIGIHVNLINGFPGEDLDEAWDTVDFVSRALRDHPNATFGLNPFTVFPLTPVSAEPERWGLDLIEVGGDMPSAYSHRLDAATRRRTAPAMAAFDELQARLEQNLGWDGFTAMRGGRSAFELYSASGHGIVFKCGASNPIDRAQAPALGATAPRPARRRRAFLTGATGAVGSAVLATLAERNWDVVAMVRDPFAAARLGCDCVIADLYDLPPLDDLLAGMDAVIHCASPRSLDRRTMLVGEVEATGRLLDSWSSGNFVYTSSQTVYGVPRKLLSEQDPVSPDNWYDLAKIANEHQVEFSARALGGVGVSLRLPLVFTGSAKPGAGNYLIDLFDALRRGDSFLFEDQRAMDEHGSVYIGDADLGSAIAAAATMTTGGTYNVASGFVTWRRLIETLGSMAGIAPCFAFADEDRRRQGRFRLPCSRSEYDTSRFEAACDFRPHMSLEQCLEPFVRAMLWQLPQSWERLVNEDAIAI